MITLLLLVSFCFNSFCIGCFIGRAIGRAEGFRFGLEMPNGPARVNQMIGLYGDGKTKERGN